MARNKFENEIRTLDLDGRFPEFMIYREHHQNSQFPLLHFNEKKSENCFFIKGVGVVVRCDIEDDGSIKVTPLIDKHSTNPYPHFLLATIYQIEKMEGHPKVALVGQTKEDIEQIAKVLGFEDITKFFKTMLQNKCEITVVYGRRSRHTYFYRKGRYFSQDSAGKVSYRLVKVKHEPGEFEFRGEKDYGIPETEILESLGAYLKARNTPIEILMPYDYLIQQTDKIWK